MDINYTAEALDEDFKVSNGVSFTVENGLMTLMAFVDLNSAWSINGMSIEERSEEIVLSVLTNGTSKGPRRVQFKIKATIEGIEEGWDGDVKIVVKEPYYS